MEKLDILLYIHGEFETEERAIVLVSPSFKGGEAILARIANTRSNAVKFVFGNEKEVSMFETWQWAAGLGARGVYNKDTTYLPGFAAFVSNPQFWHEADTSAKDARTGLSKYEVFKERVLSILRSAQREKHIAPQFRRYPDDFTFMAIDVDDFREVNKHGHDIGDECLRVLAQVIKKHIRDNIDLCCRYGDHADEFFILVQGIAEKTGKNIQESLKKRKVFDHEGNLVPFSVTIGESRVSRGEIHDAEASYKAAVRLADQRLMAQKKARSKKAGIE